MNQYWQEIKTAFKPKKYQDLFKLNDGADSLAIENWELLIQEQLPRAVKDFYQQHDGQIPYWENKQKHPGLFFGWELVPIESVTSNWQLWKELKDEMNPDFAESMSSYPPEYIKKLYAHDKWIPLVDDFAGNHVGIDLDPDIKGIPGQVILFGRDEDEKRLLAYSFEEFLEKYLDILKSQQWSIDDLGEWKIDEQVYQNFFYG